MVINALGSSMDKLMSILQDRDFELWKSLVSIWWYITFVMSD